ncbi:TPA: hypothetical protein ACPYU1_002192 [Raoultella planticola]
MTKNSALALLAAGLFLLFLLPMAGVTLAYGMAIPLVLGSALSAYSDCRAAAGALSYYVPIDLGLAAAGWGQSPGGAT